MKTYQIAYENQCISHKTESQLIDYTLKKIHMYGFEYFLFRLIPRYGNIVTHSKETLLSSIASYPSRPSSGTKRCFTTFPSYGRAPKRTV
jgi:hypothetical protein